MTFWPALGAGRSVTPGWVVGVGGITTVLAGAAPAAGLAPPAAAAGLVGSAGLAALEAGAEVGCAAPPPQAAITTPRPALPTAPRKWRRDMDIVRFLPWLFAWLARIIRLRLRP